MTASQSFNQRLKAAEKEIDERTFYLKHVKTDYYIFRKLEIALRDPAGVDLLNYLLNNLEPDPNEVDRFNRTLYEKYHVHPVFKQVIKLVAEPVDDATMAAEQERLRQYYRDNFTTYVRATFKSAIKLPSKNGGSTPEEHARERRLIVPDDPTPIARQNIIYRPIVDHLLLTDADVDRLRGEVIPCVKKSEPGILYLKFDPSLIRADIQGVIDTAWTIIEHEEVKTIGRKKTGSSIPITLCDEQNDGTILVRVDLAGLNRENEMVGLVKDMIRDILEPWIADAAHVTGEHPTLEFLYREKYSTLRKWLAWYDAWNKNDLTVKEIASGVNREDVGIGIRRIKNAIVRQTDNLHKKGADPILSLPDSASSWSVGQFKEAQRKPMFFKDYLHLSLDQTRDEVMKAESGKPPKKYELEGPYGLIANDFTAQKYWAETGAFQEEQYDPFKAFILHAKLQRASEVLGRSIQHWSDVEKRDHAPLRQDVTFCELVDRKPLQIKIKGGST